MLSPLVVVPVDTGDFGTNAMHLPRKRRFWNPRRTKNIHHNNAILCGRTRRSAPTQRYCICQVIQTLTQKNVQRVVRWNVEREGREPKVLQPTSVVSVDTGDFGTNVKHPPCKQKIWNPPRK